MRIWDAIDPAELTGYVRAALADQDRNRFALSRFLPSRPVSDLHYRFNAGGTGLAEAATFRTFDAESPIGSRPNTVRVMGELPPISRKVRLGEYDSLRLRNADDEIRDAVFNDAARMATSIAARMELARGEAISTGKLMLAENGVVATVDFDRAAGHTVSAGTSWATVATADPIQDLLTWQDTYIASNGEAPGAIITSRRVRGLLARNDKVKALAATVAGAPAIVSDMAVDQVLAAYGLPPIVTYDVQVNVAGVATRPIADDKVVFVPADSSDLGATLYGITAESQEPGYNLTGSEPGVVAGAYTSDDPVSKWTKAAAIALPVLANPDLTFTADVIA